MSTSHLAATPRSSPSPCSRMSTDDLAACGRGGLLRLVVAGCAAAAALLLTPVAALAEPDGSADSDGSAVTWSVVPARSEEHTSELQSRGHLVCRLLLEKKKYKFHS